MSHVKNSSLSACSLFCIWMCAAPVTGLLAQPLEFLDLAPKFGCGAQVTDFNNGLDDWTVIDAAGTGEKWSRIGGCEEPTPGAVNNTGGTGDAACTAPGKEGEAAPRGIEFDTSLISPDFSLAGVTAATLHFKLYGRLSGGDIFDVQISYDGGTNWVGVPIRSWRRTAGTNVTVVPLTDFTEEVSIDLAPYLGSSDTALRFRHYDPDAGDFGFYVQIDDISVDCVGGADLEINTSVIPSSPVEGQTSSLKYSITNNGPVAATSVRLLPLFDRVGAIFDLQEFIFPEGLDETALAAGIPIINPGQTLNFEFVGTFLISRGYKIDVLDSTLDPVAKLRDTSPAPTESLLDTELTVHLIEDGVSDSNDGCEPFTNASDIAGNVALSVLTLRCSITQVAENAADAGATALIVIDDSPILVELAEITDPLPILKLAREAPTADLVTAASSAGGVIISKEIISEYDFEYVSVIRAGEVDTDFSNNIDQGSFLILGDTDLDGAPDNLESCDFDPGKTEPLFCGCGIADADADASGVVDCLTTDEFAALINSLADNVKKVRRIKLTGKKKAIRKRRKKLKATKLKVKELLTQIEGFTVASASEIETTSTDVDLLSLQKKVDRKAKKALRTGSKKFVKNKKRAIKLISQFRNSLMTVSM